MATEILRPLEFTMLGGSVYPTDTPSDSYHLLINEVEPDDDATYFKIGSTHRILFGSEKCYNDFSKITSCKLFCRAQGDPEKYELECMVLKHTGSAWQDVSEEDYQAVITMTTTDWKTYSVELDANLIISAIEQTLLNSTAFTEMPLCINPVYRKLTEEGGKNDTDLPKITQVYVEITYDDEDSEVIYLKENDSWMPIPCTIYQKQNGSWVVADSSIFANGEKYITQNLE